MDKTDLTNVLVSFFKISSTGMGHFGKMHFFLSFYFLDYFDIQDLKNLLGIISFDIMVACPRHYGLKCPMLIVYKKIKILNR